MSKIFTISFVLFLFSIPTSAKIKVSGKLLAANGKPMSIAHVILTYPSDDNPIKVATVGKDGRFRIEIDSEGLWVLHFTGLFHHDYSVAIYADKMDDIVLNVKLRTYDYMEKFDRAAIIGNFNGWSIPQAVSLNADQGAKYSVIIKTKLDTLIYKFVNVRSGGTLEGNDADGYVPDGVTGYSSFLLNRKGKVRIVFDPRKMVRTDQPFDLRIITADSLETRFAKSFAIFEDTRQAYTSSLYWHVENFKIADFKFDLEPIIDSVKNLLNAEPEGLVRQVLQLDYFGLLDLDSHGHYVDPKITREVVSEIPVKSPIWSLDPELVPMALDQGAFRGKEREDYVRKMVDANPMARTVEVLLHEEIGRYFHSLQYNKITPYLAVLLDQYGDSPEAQLDDKIYSGNYIFLKDGVQAPAFSVKSQSDSTRMYTSESFKGKYCLLDFWTPANQASINEIKNLQVASEKYKEKGVKVVTVAIDSSKEESRKVEMGMSPSTWLNAIDEKGFDSQLCKDYEVYSVPKLVLIGPDGKVDAAGWELRGKNLTRTLEKYLGN